MILTARPLLLTVLINFNKSSAKRKVFNLLSQFREESVVFNLFFILHYDFPFYCNECNVLFLNFFRELFAYMPFIIYKNFSFNYSTKSFIFSLSMVK